MENSLKKSDFLSRFGLEKLWDHIQNSGQYDFATVSTDLNNGDIRLLFLEGKKNSGKIEISLKYVYHNASGKDGVVDFIVFECTEKPPGKIKINKVKVLGKECDLNNRANFMALRKTIKKFSDHVVRKNEWVNPVQLLSKNGLIGLGRGSKSWPGLYMTGDFKSANNQGHPDSEPVFAARHLRRVIGIGPDQSITENDYTRRLSIDSNYKDQTGALLQYRYIKGSKKGAATIWGRVTIEDSEEEREETLYKIKVDPVGVGKKFRKISQLEYMGKKIDLTDPVAVHTILKIIRNINRIIRDTESNLFEDLRKNPHDRRFALPTELTLHTGAYQYLNEVVGVPKEGLMTFAAIGGNNIKPYVSDHDTHIGANQYIVTYDRQGKKDKNEIEAQSIMIDAGVLFHDVFDVAFFNAARYLNHKTDISHQPEKPIQAILFTHKHKDHLGQLAYLVKHGYVVPPLVMSEFTMLQLKRDMTELGIDKNVREEILEKCYPINITQDINPGNPNKKKVTEIDGVRIEQSTEVIRGQALGSHHYYPKLQIGDFTIRVGPMPHSDPGMMFDIITPAGSHRHTGDFKLDDTIKVNLSPLEPWVKAFQPDSMSIDSTGASRDGKNPTEEDVGKEIVNILQDKPKKRHIFPMLGSNLSRLATLIHAMGQTDRKVLIIDGKAVEDLVKDSEKVYGLKQWAKDTYGIDIYNRTQLAKVRPYVSDPSRDSEYAYVVSGTQDEAYSSINRAARDWLPKDRYSLSKNDSICFLQGVIPTGRNAYKRSMLREAIESFFGADVLLPEDVYLPQTVEEEAKRFLHSSGHTDNAGREKMIRDSGLPVVLPVHGGPEDLEAHQKIAQNTGAESIITNGTSALRIRKGKKVERLEHIDSDFVGVTLHTPSPDKFYLKGRFSTSVIPVKPDVDTNVAKLVDEFENMVRYEAGVDSDYEVAKSLPISLSRYFNAYTHNGFLLNKMPFGVEKYTETDVLRSKNIFAIGAFDTETGGLDSNQHLVREFGMMMEDHRGKPIKDGNVQVFQKIPDYRMPSVEAMLVTNTSPDELDEGMPAHLFVREIKNAVSRLKEESYVIATREAPDEGLTRNNVKALAIAHNAPFDSRFLGRESSRNLDIETRAFETKGLVTINTRNISRALAAFSPRKYKVHKKEGSDFEDHTLEGLCKANAVKYDTKKSHGALYDTIPCMALFKKQRKIAPDIVDQMVLNADSSKSHLLNDMRGVDAGFNGPHPVFSYVSPMASRPKAQMGCLIGILSTDRYAVIFNLKYNPDDYLHLPPTEIHKLMVDRSSDVFEILDLRQQPIVMPAKFGFGVNAHGDLSRETIDMRAGIVKRHLTYVDPKAKWQTISQKISECWEQSRNEIYKAKIVEEGPNLARALNVSRGVAATPEEGANKLLEMLSKRGLNPVFQTILGQVKEYLVAIREENFSTSTKLYKGIKNLLVGQQQYKAINDVLDNVHYDIKPQDLLKDDRKRIECMRKYIRFVNYGENIKTLKRLESNPQKMKEINADRKAKALFAKLKNWVESSKSYGVLDAETQQFMRPWRDITRPPLPENSNSTDKPDVKVA